jgi:hypothetical protein
MALEGYDFPRDDLATLLLRRFYPERTDRESAIIRDWLLARGALYDKFSFSVRVGQGQAPTEGLEAGVARSVAFSSRKRIDVLAWQGGTPTIIECKERVTPAAIGQILTYRLLLLEEMPDAPDPSLVIIGRYSDADTLRSANAQGVDVLLYPEADAA